MSNSEPAKTERRTDCCKVGRNIDRYGLLDLNDELRARWTGDGTEKLSLRELEGYVNRHFLREAMRRSGEQPLDGEVENVYRLLVEEDASGGRRFETRRRLERAGVDVDRLLSDFVSHQSIHNHLRDCLDVDGPGELTDEQRISKRRSTVFALRNRTERVVDSAVEQLRDAGSIALGGFDVLVDVRVVCDECGTYYAIDELLENRGCDCQR